MNTDISVLLTIPARYASTRFPGKPLVSLRGATGRVKSLVHRVWEAAMLVRGVDRVVIATDDRRIFREVESFGGEAVMTSSACRNGTERCGEACGELGFSQGVVVNVQGDAPLTPPWFVEALVQAVTSGAAVATPAIRCDGKTLQSLRKDRKQGLVGGTTVVMDRRGQALYFSKEVIPWCSSTFGEDEKTPVFYHAGVYAYTVDALERYCRTEPGMLETHEGLEQLRFMESGTSIQCQIVRRHGRMIWEVNNPEDVVIVENGLMLAGIK